MECSAKKAQIRTPSTEPPNLGDYVLKDRLSWRYCHGPLFAILIPNTQLLWQIATLAAFFGSTALNSWSILNGVCVAPRLLLSLVFTIEITIKSIAETKEPDEPADASGKAPWAYGPLSLRVHSFTCGLRRSPHNKCRAQ